jgi:hypothetical protein
VLNELWAKISPNERFIAYGAVAVLVGWIVGEFIATVNLCAGFNVGGCSFSYFAAGNAGTFAILGLIAGIAAGVILYLKVAPNMSIAWPMPLPQILMGVTAVTLACGVLVVLMQVTYGLGGAPITMWLADLIFVAGGALQAWGAYQGYQAMKG